MRPTWRPVYFSRRYQILAQLKIRGTIDDRVVIEYLQGDDSPFGTPVNDRYP